MCTAVSLAGKLARNRQLRLIAAQSRHLKTRFTAIFGDAEVRTTCINRRHFESTVYYPLSALCTLHLASATAECSTDSVERVYGVALSLLNSTTDLQQMLQAVDSDVFLDLNATLGCMNAKMVVHLLRAPEDANALADSGERFMTTVTAELPLTDCEAVELWRSGAAKGQMPSDIAICRSSGSCPRDAITMGFALALGELDEYAAEELQSRKAEALCFLHGFQKDAEQRDWGSAFLSAFLCSSFSNSDASSMSWWSSLSSESLPASPLHIVRDGWSSLTLTTTDGPGNETLVVMPISSPVLRFQRVLLRGERDTVQLNYGSELQWPRKSVESSTLMQLCAVLHSSHSSTDTRIGEVNGLSILQGTSDFSSIQNFICAHGTLPNVVSHSVERGLFLLNSFLALHLASSNGRSQTDGISIPLIRLLFTPSGTVSGVAQDPHVQLVVVGESDSGERLHAYRALVTASMQHLQKTNLRKWKEQNNDNDGDKLGQRQLGFAAWNLLRKIWQMLAVVAISAATKGRRSCQEIFVWSPSVSCFADGQQLQPHRQVLSHVGQLFAADARISEVSSLTETLPNTLVLSSTSLGVQRLPLCHVFGTLQETCKHLFALQHSTLNDLAVVADDEDTADPDRAVEDASRNHQREQSSYYCPDLLLMIQDMRLELRLTQRSFPTLEFFQKAVHDVPRRVQELAMGHYGDVYVHTRVVAHWGPGLRVEVENSLNDMMENSVRGVFNPQQQDHHQGPLKLLIRAICGLYKQVFQNRTKVPLIALNSPTTRKAIDFLLYSWFMAPPQVRCFEISTRSARLAAVEKTMSQKRLDAAEETLLRGIDDYIIRAMLFYDFCGQRVLFAETHALTVREAVRRVNDLAVSLNIPTKDWFASRSKHKNASHSRTFLSGSVDSKVSVLLRALVNATSSKPRIFFVRTNEFTSSFVEGTIEVQVPLRKLRYAVPVTQECGVIGALVLACQGVLKYASAAQDAALTEVTLQFAENASPLIPRDGFPFFTARFYTPTNLLGEVIQGVASNYHCVYTVDVHTREVVCQLYLTTLAGYGNAAAHTLPFPLGVGRGWSKRAAWSAAAAQALRSNFPDFIQQVDQHKALCGLLSRPDDLLRLGCGDGFVVNVTPNVVSKGESGYQCSVTPRQKGDKEVPSIVIHQAGRAVDAYIGAADDLLHLLRQRRKECLGDGDSFSLWDPTTNYTKSVWHACCGALAVVLGGKVFLRFEGGREDADIRESDLPMSVQLVHRTWTPNNNRVTETPIVVLHERRIRDYSGLTARSRGCKPTAEQLLFASTRLLVEAVTKYTDGHTREELGRILVLLQRLKENEDSCPRLNAKRKMEFFFELTLGCQCRVVTSRVAGGKVTAQLGVWLTGRNKAARVPFVLSVCTADTTEKAVSGLYSRVQGLIKPLWATAMQSCGQ